MIGLAALSELFWSLLGPWKFMFAALSYLPGTVQRLFKSGQYRVFLSWQRLQDAWFSAFWAYVGPQIREGNGPQITALLEGRVTKACVVQTPVMPPLRGIVLDIGPGLGFWVDLYAKIRLSLREGGTGYHGGSLDIKKIYGVEPNVEAHADLTRRIQEAGLEDTYEILPVGIQSLSLAGIHETHRSTRSIEKESVDCIVTLLCLCSIPEPEKNIAELYGYLKKGGTWYLFEHVQVKGSWFMRLYQGKIMPPRFIH